ncbi:hypothetical protein ACOSQ2_026628 [Xanthoceras sorbifolium]
MNPDEGSEQAQPTRGSPLAKPPLHNLSLNHHSSPNLLENQGGNLKQNIEHHHRSDHTNNTTRTLSVDRRRNCQEGLRSQPAARKLHKVELIGVETSSSRTSQTITDLSPRRRKMGRNRLERSPRTLSCPNLFLPVGAEEESREPRKIGQGSAATKGEELP